jgi:lipopolysaccharide/colanic/teichoic acid biosynthesis glycosyltransferase
MYSSSNKPPTGEMSLMKNSVRMPVWKRALDLACCILVLPLLALCTLFMALLMKLVSPGPVFFQQERVGFQGRRFKIYKFRTMAVGADTTNHQSYFKELVGTNAPMSKLDTKGDRRLVPGGWLLRASGLDELPQLINVLRGEMSLVGPRPCLPAEYELYLPWQRERFTTMPGLTGLWQVSGKNRTTFDEMIRLDIRYARNKSLGMDLWIMSVTIPALFMQIYDTRVGRLSTEQLMQTRPPMPISQMRLPETAGNR